MAVSWAVLWGAVMLLTGLINSAGSGYGQDFLNAMASIYPGYHATPGFLQVLLGTVYGAIDGFFGGWVFAWLYNKFAAGGTLAS
jgi:hypothetical protein